MPWSLAWFVLLVLFRPVIDNFYYLKETSPFLSPLYIVGVLTPLLSVVAIIKVPKPNYSRLDSVMAVYSTLIFLSCAFLLIRAGFSMDSLEVSLKLSLPAFVYFFGRRFIRSKKDLLGIFQTFIYSAAFVLVILGYELIFNPISVQMSRGLERIQGNFADVINYAIYATCGVLLAGFYYFDKSKSWKFNKRVTIFMITVVISLVIISNIHHTASYAVIMGLFIIFLVNNLRSNLGGAVFFILTAAVVVYTFGKETIDENIMPLIETDIQVYEGEKDSEALLHGRVGRWESFLEVFDESNVVSKLIGLPSGMDEPFKYISKGAHNDFLRIMMFTGLAGLFAYLIFLFSSFMRTLKHDTPMRFLGLGTLAIFFLYSISTTPSLYAPLLYILIPVFCMLALPVNMMDKK